VRKIAPALLVGALLFLSACSTHRFGNEALLRYDDTWPEKGTPRVEVLHALGKPDVVQYDKTDGRWIERMSFELSQVETKKPAACHVPILGGIGCAIAYDESEIGPWITRTTLFVEFDRTGLLTAREWAHDVGQRDGMSVRWRPAGTPPPPPAAPPDPVTARRFK
jgi:hypothetical protein